MDTESNGFSLKEKFIKYRSYYSEIPKHVLLLPDGQRRYAVERGIDDRGTYKLARKSMEGFLTVVFKNYNLSEASVFLLRPHSFSRQGRTKENVRQIFQVVNEFSEDMFRETPPMGEINGLQFRAITLVGKEWMHAPEAVQKDKYLLEDWLKMKANFSRLQEKYAEGNRKLNFLVNYSGKAELDYALKHGKDKLQITNEIGLTIRCGDSLRLSDCPLYALWQSHFLLIPKYFPEVSKRDFKKALGNYFKRAK